MKKAFLLIVFLLIAISFQPLAIRADELEDLQKQINELSKAREMSVNATKPLEGQLSSLKVQLAQIQNKLAVLSANITQKEKDIKVREEKLVTQQALLAGRVRSYYIRSYAASPLMVILSSGGSGNLFRELTYRQAAAKEDQSVISSVTADMLDIIIQKEKLVKDKAVMAVMQIEVDKNAKFIGGEVAKAKDYQSNLTKQIAQLSAKQQQILAQKLSSLGLPTSAYTTLGGCSSDIDIDPGFGPRFALFTFGVPHRVGMSQYGAKGRADAGQNTDTILHAYYNFDSYQNMNATIKVNDGRGFNTGNIIWTGGLDDYVKRIYEVPDNWPADVLKAQAIAARSYALATTNNGDKSICATQDCQVFKTNPKGGNWDNAVNQTAGQVMIQGGNPIQAWFSSTAGGYAFSSGTVWGGEKPWTKNMSDANGAVNSFTDLKNNAYDKESKWFYCDWGARGDKKTAWLRPEEIADIVNSILLVQVDSSTDPHILQTDKNDPNMWNEDKVKEELRKYRNPFNNISSANVSADFGSGKSTTVHFSGDAGSVDLPADVFKKYFNLRAPSNINIVGSLFNIERK